MKNSRKPRVLVTRAIPPAGLEALQAADLDHQSEDRPIERHELLARLKGKDALFSLVTDTIDQPVFESSPSLVVVANMGVGYDNIDVAEATRQGVMVTNTPDVLTDATADLAMALMLATARRVVEGDRWARSGEWPGWGPLQMLGTQVTGATLGMIGLGRIGRAFAKRARAFDMELLYWNRTRLEASKESALGIAYTPLGELLSRSDFLSLHVAYNQDTHHIIGPREIERMKPSAILINTARGACIDENALVSALEKGHLGGAGLDVFEKEPEIHPGLFGLDNVVLLPHLGSSTAETRNQMAELAAQNLLAACHGETPKNLVNPDVWQRRRTLR